MDHISITEDNGAPKAGKGLNNASVPLAAGMNTGAPNLTDIVAQLGRSSELSSEANQYIESLTEALKKEFGEDKVIVARIPDKLLDIYRVTYANNTIMLTFGETYITPIDSHIPPTDQIGPAANVLRATVGGTLLNNIVITRNDYKEVSKMATHIINVFKFAIGTFGQITIDSLRKGRYTVSTNITEVRDAIKRFNPKSTMPRTDIGIVLYAKEEVGGVGNQPGVTQSTPILVIGAYTNIVSTAGTSASYTIGNNSPSFLPIVTITSILSQVMTPEIISIAIPLATDDFIRRNGWLRNYTKFSKKDANLGALTPDEKGKPYFIDNMSVLLEFYTKHLSRPFLAIDITDGYARIPGIEGLRYGTDIVQRGIAKFLNLNESEAAGEIVYQRFCEYIGELENGTDSREVDYLNMVAKGVTDMNQLLRYLYIPSEPHHRAQLINKSCDMKSLYTNVRVVLNPEYIDRISAYVATKFNPIWENCVVENNLGNLSINGGNQFAIGPTFGMGGMSQRWNGFVTNPFGRV